MTEKHKEQINESTKSNIKKVGLQAHMYKEITLSTKVERS